MSQKLELTPETIEYCLELERELKNLQNDLDDAAAALKDSFDRHSQHLGVHTDDFEEWVNSAKLSMEKNAMGSVEDVRRNLLNIAKRIADYVGNSDGGAASTSSKVAGRGTVWGEGGEIADFTISQDGGMTIMPVHRPLPKNNVIWENPQNPGEGACVLRDDAVISFRSGQYTVTGAELNKHYGGPIVVNYTNGQPDFSPYRDMRINFVKISNFTDNRNSNFAQANAIVAERFGITKAEVDAYMDKFMLTWHECADRQTMMAVPTAIHDAFKHYGGVSTHKAVHRVIQRFDSMNCRVITPDRVYTGRAR
ncbi:MAG: HNH endonuclease [Oscillospiraceae bacterium]|nr:HNH endonuclease [Oscillospiraceae bacterium]